MKPNRTFLEVNGVLMGSEERHLSALDRGFALADGVFDTLRVVHGQPFRLPAHLHRLRASAAVLRLPISPSDLDLASSIDRVLAANDMNDAIVRVSVTRGAPSERGLIPPKAPALTVVVQASPWRPLSPTKLATGFAVRISSIRRNELSPSSRIKACNYLDNVLARMEADEAGADEAILLNTTGALACCSSANLFLVRDRFVCTPPVHCGALPGVTRTVVRQLTKALGLEWLEVRLEPTEVWTAQEAFLTNSALGIVPVTLVDGRQVGNGLSGPITVDLASQYQMLVERESA